ncbi:unnamed protein product [Closterium sp. NIES-53]
MYLMTCTRPHLAYPLSILARYVAPGRHRPEHMAAVKRVLRYLCSTSGTGLVLGGRRPVVLTGHADASWADDQATQRSSQGYTFSLGSGSVSWRSTRLSSVLSSSYEAEIYAGAMAAQELRWLTYLLTDLGEQPRSPPVLYVDNKAMLALCREHRLEHRTKHIALRYFLARELQQRGQLRLAYVASEANTADIFTKALAPGDHQRFCTMLACFALLDWSCDLLFSPTLPMGIRMLPLCIVLFLRTDTSLLQFYILVYVHDFVFATADTAGLTHVKSKLQKRQTSTDLGELRSYLGLQITRDRAHRTITLTQSHMVQQVLQRFDFTYSSPQATPLSTRHSLSALPSDESVEPSGLYPELVGCLMYLMTCTRPDLAYPLSILARYVAPGRHRPEHMATTKRVLRYLCSTSGLGLVLGGRSPVVLTGHADASWVVDLATQQSSQGYTFSLGSDSVSWRSTRSSWEADIYAGAMAAQELRWLTYLLTDLGEPPRSPPVLYVDNKAMLVLCREHRREHRTKHIALRYFLARELQQRGQLRLAYVASEANTADIFTKALRPCDHQRFCTMLAGPSGSGGVRGAGEAGRGVVGGFAPIASVSTPAKDDVKAFNLEKFSGEDWASWSFRMELLFNHYGLLEVMDGELKRLASEGATKEWDRRSKDGFFLLSQCLSIQCGPKAWKILKDVHAPSSEAMVVVLERQLHAVKINEGDAVQGAFDQLRDLYVKLSAAGVDYPEKIKCYKALSLLPDSWGPLVVNLNGMKDSWSIEWIRAQVLQEEFRRKELAAAAGEGGGSAYGMKGLKGRGSKKGKAKEGSGGEQYSGGKRSKVALHRSSHWVIDTGAFMTMTNREDLLDEVRPSKAATVVSATGQVVPVRGEGRAMFMGADGRLVGLKRVLLVPGLCANLLSTKALSEAGMKMEMMGTNVFKSTLDGRVLWDLRGGKDMHRSMWEIPVLPWKEAAARLAAEAVRGGHASHVTSGGGGDGSDGGLLVHGGGALPSVFTEFQDNPASEQHVTAVESYCSVVMVHCWQHFPCHPFIVVMPMVQGQRMRQEVQVVKWDSTTLLLRSVVFLEAACKRVQVGRQADSWLA